MITNIKIHRVIGEEELKEVLGSLKDEETILVYRPFYNDQEESWTIYSLLDGELEEEVLERETNLYELYEYITSIMP